MEMGGITFCHMRNENLPNERTTKIISIIPKDSQTTKVILSEAKNLDPSPVVSG